jgi:hypothetical protein
MAEAWRLMLHETAQPRPCERLSVVAAAIAIVLGLSPKFWFFHRYHPGPGPSAASADIVGVEAMWHLLRDEAPLYS